ALRAREAGHVFAEERGERAHQLLRHLRLERVPAKLAGRAVRADEGDAGRTSAQVIFERPGPLGRQCSLDVFAEEIDALLAMVDRGRQRALPGGSRLDGWVSQPTCMQRCTSTNADS